MSSVIDVWSVETRWRQQIDCRRLGTRRRGVSNLSASRMIMLRQLIARQRSLIKAESTIDAFGGNRGAQDPATSRESTYDRFTP
jgi:hypothetical protein